MQRSLRHLWWCTAVLGALATDIGCAPPAPESVPDEAPTAPDDIMNSRVEHLRALDEDVTMVKTSGSVYAIRADGRQQSLLELQAEERAAKLVRWGALDPDFDPQLRAAPVGQLLPVAFHFDPHVSWSELTPALHRAADRAAAQAKLQAAIGDGAQRLAAELTGLGVAQITYRDTMPVVFGLATAPTIQALARHPDLKLIMSNAPGRPQLHAGPPNTISDPQTDTGMNALGLFGANQRIGFLEEAKCGLYDPHEAFSQNGSPITYEVEPMDCTSDSQCTSCDLGGGARCLALGHAGHPKQCVAVHASETASCVSATRSGTGNGASRASMFHPNAGGSSPLGPDTVACSASGTVDAYDWLTKNNVTTANESWGCTPPLGAATAATLEGLAEDWYARTFGISIFKSAGNDPRGTACPFTLNSICVGGTNTAHAMSCFSSWMNPAGPGGKQSDREEPDITALAGDSGNGCEFPLGQVEVMQVGNPTGWTGSDGTSFASPAMAGFAALVKESCGGDLDEKLVRVIMRNSAWPRNPSGWAYSTPQPGFDHKDGGGSPIAQAAVAFCQPSGGGPDNKFGLDPGDLHNGHPGPQGKAPPTGPPPGKQRRAPSGTVPGPSDGRLYNTFFQTRFRTGNRIRVSFAWDSCPASTSGTAPATVATDYDLFLYNEDTGTYVYSSQSFDDSTEGFDVTIPSDGTYTVYYAWPEKTTGCGGSGFEPFGWAVTWWQ
jgi:hypothetical protein